MGIFYQNELESHHAIEKQIQCLKMETVLEVVKTISKLVELIENGEMLTLNHMYCLCRLYHMTLYYKCFHKITKIGMP